MRGILLLLVFGMLAISAAADEASGEAHPVFRKCMADPAKSGNDCHALLVRTLRLERPGGARLTDEEDRKAMRDQKEGEQAAQSAANAIQMEESATQLNYLGHLALLLAIPASMAWFLGRLPRRGRKGTSKFPHEGGSGKS